jgi:hypothetical protein
MKRITATIRDVQVSFDRKRKTVTVGMGAAAMWTMSADDARELGVTLIDSAASAKDGT